MFGQKRRLPQSQGVPGRSPTGSRASMKPPRHQLLTALVHAKKKGFIKNSSLVKTMKKPKTINTDLITLSQGHKKLSSNSKKIPPDKAPLEEVKEEQDWEHNESLC